MTSVREAKGSSEEDRRRSQEREPAAEGAEGRAASEEKRRRNQAKAKTRQESQKCEQLTHN